MRSLEWCRFIAIAGVLGSMAACGAPPDSTETVSSDLLENVPYLPGQTLQARGGTGPGATIFKGDAYFTYVRSNNQIGIAIESNVCNGTGQSATSYALTDTTNYGASLVVFNTFLDLFYVGMDNNLYMRRSADGINWAGPWQIDGEGFWQFIPAPVVFNGQLFVFVVANLINGPDIMQLDISGNSVSTIYFTGEYSNVAPSAVTWNGNVYLSWDSLGSTNIDIKHSSNLIPPTWSNISVLPVAGNPGLFPLSSQTMELVFGGNNAHIYRMYTNDGVSFGAAIEDLASTTNHKPLPFLAASASDVWVYYIGQNNELFTALE
jgi:hypothetical protein